VRQLTPSISPGCCGKERFTEVPDQVLVLLARWCRVDEGVRPAALHVATVQDPEIQDWGMEEEDNGDPPRLWHPEGSYPGTAFTRSIGDSGATSSPPRTD
jgi:hypothetical protein